MDYNEELKKLVPYLAKIKELEAERNEWRHEANALLERNSELRRKLELAEALNKLTARVLGGCETEKP